MHVRTWRLPKWLWKKSCQNWRFFPYPFLCNMYPNILCTAVLFYYPRIYQMLHIRRMIESITTKSCSTGRSFRKFQKWNTVAQKRNILDPMLLKPKCTWKAVVHFNHFRKLKQIPRLSNVFWLYQQKVQNASFLSYSLLIFFNSSNGTPCSIFFLQQLHFYYHFSRGLMTDLRIGSPMMASPLSGSIPITIEEAVSLKSLLLGSSCKPFPNGWMGMKPAVLPTL